MSDTEHDMFGPVHTEQLKQCVAAEIDDDTCSQDQRPPRDETTVEEAAESTEIEAADPSDVAPESASGQQRALADIVKPVGKRARGT